MSVKLQPNMTQNARDLRICEDYWSYDNESDYIAHVETVCEKYEISAQVLFETVGAVRYVSLLYGGNLIIDKSFKFLSQAA